ncbi:hypothetical protein F5B20DRAFT_84856 [Whalleya microplaca]|nr:hypothetical protein F5B20DRAFT_84856 [Whalleya microplaca]
MEPRIRGSTGREDPNRTNQRDSVCLPELYKGRQHTDETLALALPLAGWDSANTHATPETNRKSGNFNFSLPTIPLFMALEIMAQDTTIPVCEARGEELAKQVLPGRFGQFFHLPLEVRMAIWALATPSRVVRVHDLVTYLRYPRVSPAVKVPALAKACGESGQVLRERGTTLRFMDSHMTLVHEHWYDRRSDLFYIPSLRVFKSWEGWGDLLARGTVIVNALELIEDKYRYPDVSDLFPAMVGEGRFKDVDTFLLSLMTVECGEDLDIYQDGDTAVVDLDDPKLPSYLKPVFENLRTLYPGKLMHSRPAKLLRHLRSEWTKDLKTMFEEQWLQGQGWYENGDDESEELMTEKCFGYWNRRRLSNRSSRVIRKRLSRMPKIRPVLIFEKRWPSTTIDGNRYRQASHSHTRRRLDPLEAISNRRRMCLTTEIIAGRETLYPWS